MIPILHNVTSIKHRKVILNENYWNSLSASTDSETIGHGMKFKLTHTQFIIQNCILIISSTKLCH